MAWKRLFPGHLNIPFSLNCPRITSFMPGPCEETQLWGAKNSHPGHTHADIWTLYNPHLQRPLLEAKVTVCWQVLEEGALTNSFLCTLNLKPGTFTVALQTLSQGAVEYSATPKDHTLFVEKENTLTYMIITGIKRNL